ncbi:hypothetical protein GMSM_14670 [Geomonas sp. Red276]
MAPEVLQHINELHRAALDKLASGSWEGRGSMMLSSRQGDKFRLNFLRRRPFELGVMLVADTMVAFLIDGKHRPFFDNAVRTVTGFRYASESMEQEVSRYLPTLLRSFETGDGQLVMVLKKSPDLLLLADVFEHYRETGQPDQWPRHVAWIQSTLHNLCCYLEWAGLTHNDISPHTYFVSPLNHSGALLGGWWYAARQGEKLLGVPARTYALMPLEVKEMKLADPRVDLESVRCLGREALGDVSGMNLLRTRPVPGPMLDWLRHPTTGSAIRDYRLWREEVLVESFGPRRFVEMRLTARDLYV